MKRFACCILGIISVFTLVACNRWDIEKPNDTTVADVAADGPEDRTVDPTIFYEASSQFCRETSLISAPGMLFFTNVFKKLPLYVNLSTGKIYPFCFSPGCEHRKDSTCVAGNLRLTYHYTYYDGYIYCAYISSEMGQDSTSGIARIALDGSSMEVLYRINTMRTTFIKAGGGYVYLTVKETEGNVTYQYNVETGNTKRLTGREDYFGARLIVTDDRLFFQYDNERSIISTDHELKDEKVLFEASDIIYADNKLYHMKGIKSDDGKMVSSVEFYEYDLATDVDRRIGSIDGGVSYFLCVAEGYLYYSPNTNVKVKTHFPDDRLSRSGGVIRRINIATGEDSLYFDNIAYDMNEMFCYNGTVYACLTELNADTWLGTLSYGNRVFGSFEEKDGKMAFVPFEWDFDDWGSLSAMGDFTKPVN